MTSTNRLNEMMAANARYEHAAKDLTARTEAALPVGSEVAVTLGRSRVRGRVIRSGGAWWYRPAEVVIRNNDTGKLRRFDACSLSIELLVITRDSSEEPPSINAVDPVGGSDHEPTPRESSSSSLKSDSLGLTEKGRQR